LPDGQESRWHGAFDDVISLALLPNITLPRWQETQLPNPSTMVEAGKTGMKTNI